MLLRLRERCKGEHGDCSCLCDKAPQRSPDVSQQCGPGASPGYAM
jgi:hypothetical protein